MLHQLVSVIIPCYNYGKYLGKAIESILSQSYQCFEVIVVDDGSTDETKEVVQNYHSVKYIYQSNQGVSKARNTGINNSSGTYLVFLDADDWLLPDALFININYLTKNPELAFVSGAHKYFYQPENKSWDIIKEITGDFYCNLLKGNYIGTPSATMYQKWVFNKIQFDTSLKYCEDYDLYLRIARKFSILHHTQLIAVYYNHENNTSSSVLEMLKHALLVLNKQEYSLLNEVEKECYNQGIIYWKAYYSDKIYNNLLFQLYSTTLPIDNIELEALKENNFELYVKFITENNSNNPDVTS